MSEKRRVCTLCKENFNYHERNRDNGRCKPCNRFVDDKDTERNRLLFATYRSAEITSPAFVGKMLAASAEGRLDPALAEELNLDTGSHRCPVCGMLNWTMDEADDCCLPGVAEFAEERLLAPESQWSKYDVMYS